MSLLVLIFAIIMVFICVLVFWTYLNTVYGAENETYHKGNILDELMKLFQSPKYIEENNQTCLI